MKKIAVIFPGIGYHADKPLLYYSRMLAREAGYEVVEVPYRNFPPRIRGDAQKMKLALETGLSQAEEMLARIAFDDYDSILFISKSIGTAIACAYGSLHGIPADHLWYTPLAETFMAAEKSAGQSPIQKGRILAFHGTADPWAETAELLRLCRLHRIPLKLTEGGNHSLETGDAIRDLGALMLVMEESGKFIRGEFEPPSSSGESKEKMRLKLRGKC